MCGLEGVFDLYWKHKLKKDKQLQSKLNNLLESDQEEHNMDDEQVQHQVVGSYHYEKISAHF